MFQKKSRQSCEIGPIQPKKPLGLNVKVSRAQTFSIQSKIQNSPKIKVFRGQSENKNQQELSFIDKIFGTPTHIHQMNTRNQYESHENQQQKNNENMREGFTVQELTKIFYVLSNDKDYIYPDDLLDMLEEINELGFKRYEMIRMMDSSHNGYISLDEFISFFENKTEVDSSFLFKLPEQFQLRAKWKKAIDENYQTLEPLLDKDFCQYVKKIVSQK